MSQIETIAELNFVLAHLWMIRTFLKHAEEIEDDADFLEVPRTLYDTIRAVEPSFQSGDHAKYLRRLKGKLPKLRKIEQYMAAEYRRVSAHTNFEMASQSLTGCVRQMEQIFAELKVEAEEPNDI